MIVCKHECVTTRDNASQEAKNIRFVNPRRLSIHNRARYAGSTALIFLEDGEGEEGDIEEEEKEREEEEDE